MSVFFNSIFNPAFFGFLAVVDNGYIDNQSGATT